MESILFDGVANPTTLEEVIGQAVGAASVCWESMEGAGIFQDAKARQIVDDVVGWVNQNYTRSTPEPSLEDPDLGKDLTRVINYYSLENGSNTPDWILAELMLDIMNAFNKATNARTKWYSEGELHG